MSWIEGIGDEVTIGIVVLVGLCILLAAWLSTGTRDIPFISVIIVQLTRRRVRLQNAILNQGREGAVQESSNTENENDNSGTATHGHGDGDAPNTTNVAEGVETVPAVDSGLANPESEDVDSQQDRGVNHKQEDEPDICASSDSPKSDEERVNESNSKENETDFHKPSDNELRQRRLEFFSGNAQTCERTVEDSTKTSEEKSTDGETDVKKNASTCDTNPKSVPKPQTISQLASDFLSEELSSTISEQSGSSIDPLETDTLRQSNEPEIQSETAGESEVLPGEIRVRIKFLNDTQRLVTSLPHETIGNFRRKHFSAELSESKLVRFIFNGQDLRNDASTLENYNIIDNSILHCLVTQPRQQEQQHGNHGDGDDGLDIGLFMFPLFGLLLAIVWYMRLMYRQFFNVTSTLTLGGITFLYIAAFMSSFRGHRGHEHLD